MKQEPFFLLVGIGALCIIFSILVIVFGANSNSLQSQLNAEQAQITNGQIIQKTAENILMELGKASLQDDKIKQLLLDNGYHVNVQPNPNPAQ